VIGSQPQPKQAHIFDHLGKIQAEKGRRWDQAAALLPIHSPTTSSLLLCPTQA